MANLFAVHLVRIPSFKSFHRHVGEELRDDDVPSYATNAEVTARFEA